MKIEFIGACLSYDCDEKLSLFSNDKFFICNVVSPIVIAAIEVRNFMKLIKEKDEAVDDKKEHGQPGVDEEAEKKERSDNLSG